jgi:hypothetical protein
MASPLLIIPALVFLWGCTRRSDESERAKTQPEVASTPLNTSYSYPCIRDSPCGDNEKRAAIYDYVGSVYAPGDSVVYDRKLTPQEEPIVLSEIGALTSPLEEPSIQKYFGQAQDFYFSRRRHTKPEKETQSCGRALSFDESLNQGRVKFLGGDHGCARNYGESYFKKGIELAVASEPNAWIFFIETEDNPEGGAGEAAYFHRIAAKLDIPVYNPVEKKTFGLENIRRAAQKNGYTEEDYIGYVIFSLLVQDLDAKGAMRDYELSLDTVTRAQAAEYQRTPEQLKDIFFKYCRGKRPGETVEQLWKRLFKDSRWYQENIFKKTQILINALKDSSNQSNVELIKSHLEKHPDRPNAFFQTGFQHQQLVQSVFSK